MRVCQHSDTLPWAYADLPAQVHFTWGTCGSASTGTLYLGHMRVCQHRYTLPGAHAGLPAQGPSSWWAETSGSGHPSPPPGSGGDDGDDEQVLGGHSLDGLYLGD